MADDYIFPGSTIAIANDHAGTELKNILKAEMEAEGLTVVDLGTPSLDSVDYPDFADKLAQEMKSGTIHCGVLICGSGIGISIAANRHRHLRAALCTNGLMAKLARQHNNANVLVLGSRLTGEDMAKECLQRFLHTPFEGGRHTRRVEKMS